MRAAAGNGESGRGPLPSASRRSVLLRREAIDRVDGLAQPLLLFGREVGLQELPLVLVAELVEDLVLGGGADEQHQRGAARAELPAEVLQERVVHADVRHGPARGPRGRADGHADQRREEQQADEAAPQGTAGGADADERRGLAELDPAVAAVLDDDRVVELDELAFLHVRELAQDRLRRGDVRVGHGDEFAHASSSLRAADGGVSPDCGGPGVAAPGNERQTALSARVSRLAGPAVDDHDSVNLYFP
jgi:hypothetical protein